MKKFLIGADVHWSQGLSIIRKRGNKYSQRLETLINSLNWFEDLANSEKCDEVWYLGDTMDRPDMNSEEITAIKEVKFADIPHKFLVGNHESNVGSLQYSTTSIFSGQNSEIINSVKVIEVNGVEIYFIPYIADHKVLSIKSYLNNNNKKKVVVTHNDLAGIKYGKFLSEVGFNIDEILDNCSLFLNGHLHNGHVINDKIILVGDLVGCNFNEDAYKYDHYAYIMTVEDDGRIGITPVVNPYAFNFYKIYINSQADIKRLDSLKNNAVISAICDGDLLKEVNDKISQMNNVAEYRLLANYSRGKEESTTDFSVEDHLKQFINYAQTKIDPSQILSEELSILGGYSES